MSDNGSVGNDGFDRGYNPDSEDIQRYVVDEWSDVKIIMTGTSESIEGDGLTQRLDSLQPGENAVCEVVVDGKNVLRFVESESMSEHSFSEGGSVWNVKVFDSNSGVNYETVHTIGMVTKDTLVRIFDREDIQYECIPVDDGVVNSRNGDSDVVYWNVKMFDEDGERETIRRIGEHESRALMHVFGHEGVHASCMGYTEDGTYFKQESWSVNNGYDK